MQITLYPDGNQYKFSDGKKSCISNGSLACNMAALAQLGLITNQQPEFCGIPDVRSKLTNLMHEAAQNGSATIEL